MNESEESTLNLLDLPSEILEKIIIYLPLQSLPTLSATCKYFNAKLRSDRIWRLKWKCLVNSSNLILNEPSRLEPIEDYYHCSQRLLRVCYRPQLGLGTLEPIHDCSLTSCSSKCKENDEKKFAIDIGSKVTWVMTSGYFLERHPSILVIPLSDLSSPENEKSFPIYNNKVRCLLCSHHEPGDTLHQKNYLRPQIIKTERVTLDEETVNCDHYYEAANLSVNSREQSSAHAVPRADSAQFSADSSTSSAQFAPLPRSSNPLMRPKFKLWSEISFMLRDAKIDHEIFHPAQCFFGTEDFKYLETYLRHLIEKLDLNEIKKPNSSLVFCEPFNSDMEMRLKLSRFFMETMQANRVCFVNKSLATALLFGIGTCVVIDSGARNTVVSVIIEGAVQNDRVQHCPIGGTEIAQYLADAIKLNGLKNDVYVPSLDSDRVKSRCFLALNPSLEEKRGNTAKRKVFVRCVKEGPGPHLEEIRLGSELFLAPELTYAAMDLSRRLKTALMGLETPLVKEILSHIILTGSNTELKGFSIRLARDLQTAFPQHVHSIFLKSNSGSHSWDAVTGAMYVPILYRNPEKLTESYLAPNKLTPGSIMWVTREDYILKGPALFQQ